MSHGSLVMGHLGFGVGLQVCERSSSVINPCNSCKSCTSVYKKMLQIVTFTQKHEICIKASPKSNTQ